MIYQSIGKWDQEIRFQCQTRDSSTLTNTLVTSYFQEVISDQFYNVIYQNIQKWDQEIHF